MHIDTMASTTIPAERSALFALATDAERFPALFAGCGPIPGLQRITLRSPLAIGCVRDVEASDGSVMQETVTALDPPYHHGYRLSGLRAPLAWLVTRGDADWTFRAAGAATEVHWRYRWQLTHPLAWPLAMPLLTVFMQQAMQRCLAALAAAFAPGTESR